MPIIADAKTFPAVIAPISAVSTDVGMYLIHDGTGSGVATIEVNAGGDLLFVHDGAADTGVNTTGTIDLSTPAAGFDTMGELVDYINTTTHWKAILWGSRRANLTDNRFITMAATSAKAVLVGLLHDTTTVGATSTYIIGQCVSRANLQGQVDAGWRNAITLIEGVYTAAAQVGIIVVYSINDLTKTETEVWRNGTALASGTAFQFDQADWGEMPIYGKPGERLLVQVQVPNGAAYTSPRLVIKGFHQMVSSAAGAGPGRLAPISGQ